MGLRAIYETEPGVFVRDVADNAPIISIQLEPILAKGGTEDNKAKAATQTLDAATETEDATTQTKDAAAEAQATQEEALETNVRVREQVLRGQRPPST